MFWSDGCSLLRAEGFFCNLDILYGKVNCSFWSPKIFFFSCMVNFLKFLVIKTLDPDWIRIRIGVQPKMLDPDLDQMNTDLQPEF